MEEKEDKENKGKYEGEGKESMEKRGNERKGKYEGEGR